MSDWLISVCNISQKSPIIKKSASKTASTPLSIGGTNVFLDFSLHPERKERVINHIWKVIVLRISYPKFGTLIVIITFMIITFMIITFMIITFMIIMFMIIMFMIIMFMISVREIMLNLDDKPTAIVEMKVSKQAPPDGTHSTDDVCTTNHRCVASI